MTASNNLKVGLQVNGQPSSHIAEFDPHPGTPDFWLDTQRVWTDVQFRGGSLSQNPLLSSLLHRFGLIATSDAKVEVNYRVLRLSDASKTNSLVEVSSRISFTSAMACYPCSRRAQALARESGVDLYE